MRPLILALSLIAAGSLDASAAMAHAAARAEIDDDITLRYRLSLRMLSGDIISLGSYATLDACTSGALVGSAHIPFTVAFCSDPQTGRRDVVLVNTGNRPAFGKKTATR